jgi:SAM-dependent methyltransferase
MKIKDQLFYKILRELKRTYITLMHYLRGCGNRIRDIIIDQHYENELEIQTAENCPVNEDPSLYKDAIWYEPTPYSVLEKTIKYLKFTPDDVFIDFGCGKGRVIFFVATQRIKKVIGIELQKELAAIAKANLSRLKISQAHVEILNCDSVNFNPTEGTIFFLYNPSGDRTVVKIIENIKNSLISYPRKIRIIFYYLAQRRWLESQNWLEREKDDIGDIRVSVWRNKQYCV